MLRWRKRDTEAFASERSMFAVLEKLYAMPTDCMARWSALAVYDESATTSWNYIYWPTRWKFACSMNLQWFFFSSNLIFWFRFKQTVVVQFIHTNTFENHLVEFYSKWFCVNKFRMFNLLFNLFILTERKYEAEFMFESFNNVS